ncbi:MAG: cell division protein ZapD [Gammaproteobacteria bacterium]|jgi:cell division protein ZapD|nr:cell division protein ZapD [Gammaproteobacteria bacterium]MBT3724927.1 cell division protein ZapD [Gammaproteobacteria bacterium]MBT4075953.1 cell division protein ZapD [Gammaproteobacteria bacterium]MBT4194980.1 cell division protein ZapD [Gammaproteobacteria bacterium]MBT4449599.1 cell division protein ZapD [Gammaproteobacteria bacterium]
MTNNTFIFEQPLNERIRIFLRIEALIHRLDFFKQQDNDHSSYHAALTVLELTALVERGDIKQETIKELERQHKVLKALISHQSVDKSRLELILSKIKHALTNMHAMDGRFGEHLKKIDFLLTIKQRAGIPGGSCDFDIPQLRFWLNHNFQTRVNDIVRWSQPYYQLNEVVVLILNLIRDSALAERVTAKNGFFQNNLDTTLANQMLRIELDCNSNFFPEISAGKHRYSIRFLQPQEKSDLPPVQLKQDLDFKLFLCAL